MKKSFRILLTLVLVLVTLLSLTACISNCDAGMHAFVEIPAKEAICTESGNVAYKRCRVCELCLDENGKQISLANTVIPAKGHELDEHPASASTCTADGTVQYWECKTCGKKFSDKDATTEIAVIVVGATGHVNTTHVNEIPATCKTAGTKAHDKCSCGALLIDGKIVEEKDLVIEIDTTAHKFGTWADEVPATCTTEGTLGHQDCEYCKKHFDINGKEITDLTIGKTTHTYDQEVENEQYLVSNATCKDYAVYHKSCKCGAIGDETFNGTTLAEHTYGDWIVGKDAACDKDGEVAHYHCSVCNKNYDKSNVEIENVVIAAHGHDYGTLVAKQPATCIATGREAYYYCESCKTYFTESKVVTNWADLEIAIDSTNHTALTTGDTDETYHYGAHCTDCGYTQAKEEHKGQGWIHAVDTNGKHYHYQQCSCGYILDKADCTPGVPVDENVHDSNCLETGTKDVVTYCTVCEKEISRQTGVVIEKKSHTYGDWIAEVPATCVEEGTLGHYHCSACEHNFDSSKNELSSLTIAGDTTNGHNWQEVEEKLATCTEDGYTAHQECTLCHTTTGKTVLPKGHVIVNHNGQAPTCTEAGWEAYETCSRCEYSTKVEIPATGHLHTTHKDEILATCTTAGTKAHDVCDDCGALLIEGKVVEEKGLVIPVDTTNGHNPATSWTATEDGSQHYHKCQNEGCDAKLDLADHNIEGASWKQDDTKHWKECVNCGAKVDETAHTPVTDKAVDPDCTNAGKTEGSHCEICSKILVKQTDVPATGHNYGTWIDEKPATCTEVGEVGHYHCSVCGKNFDTERNELKDLEIQASHIWVYEDTSSTHHTVTCEREGCTYTAQVEHSYSETEHKCVCGKAAPTVTLVTDVSDLKVGDKIIIVGIKSDKYYALSTNQKDKNRSAVAIEKNGDALIINSSVQVITIVDAYMPDLFAFYVEENKNGVYLYAPGDSNSLKTGNDYNESSSWQISISDNKGAATIKAQCTNNNPKNILRFNSNQDSNLLFSCYASGQSDVYIYKLVECTHPEKFATTTHIGATCTEPGKNVVSCSYCGTTTTTEIASESALGHDLTYTTTDTHHSANCSRCDYVVESTLHSYGDTHVCVCGKTEPAYTITITNPAVDGNSATVVVKVGDETIIPADGVYSIYQGSEVTITVTAPTGYMFDTVKNDDVSIESFTGSCMFTLNGDTIFEITIKAIPSSHTHEYTIAVPLDEENEQYGTHHQMKCSCGAVSEALVVHNCEAVDVEDNNEQHKLVCACGYEKLVDHSFGVIEQCDETYHQYTCENCNHIYKVEHDYTYDEDAHKCGCGIIDPDYVFTVVDALATATGKKVDITGMIVEFYSSGKNSFYLQDEENAILVFSPNTTFGLGDKVRVVGTVGQYKDVNQITNGTVTRIAEHVCDKTGVTCAESKTCDICGKTITAEHIYNEEGVCTGCGATKPTEIKVTVSIGDYAEKNAWKSNSDKYSTIELDENVTVTASGGNNTGKYYNTEKEGISWRIYASDSPAGTVKISVKDGFELVSIKITAATGTYAYLKLNDEDICNKVVSVSGQSVTFTSAKNGSSGKQVRITAIEVVYKQVANSEVDA